MTKYDLKDGEMESRIKAFRKKHRDTMVISSVAQLGIKQLLDRVWSMLQGLREA